MPTPVFPTFYYILDANLGLLLHGDVAWLKGMRALSHDFSPSNKSKNNQRRMSAISFLYFIRHSPIVWFQ